MVVQETEAQRQARLRQEALQAFYARQAAMRQQNGINGTGHDYGVANQQRVGGVKPQVDNRGFIQRIMDALSGNP